MVFLNKGQKKSLAIFEDCLKSVPGEFNHETIDIADVVQKLLFFDNSNVTNNEQDTGIGDFEERDSGKIT